MAHRGILGKKDSGWIKLPEKNREKDKSKKIRFYALDKHRAQEAKESLLVFRSKLMKRSIQGFSTDDLTTDVIIKEAPYLIRKGHELHATPSGLLKLSDYPESHENGELKEKSKEEAREVKNEEGSIQKETYNVELEFKTAEREDDRLVPVDNHKKNTPISQADFKKYKKEFYNKYPSNRFNPIFKNGQVKWESKVDHRVSISDVREVVRYTTQKSRSLHINTGTHGNKKGENVSENPTLGSSKFAIEDFTLALNANNVSINIMSKHVKPLTENQYTSIDIMDAWCYSGNTNGREVEPLEDNSKEIQINPGDELAFSFLKMDNFFKEKCSLSIATVPRPESSGRFSHSFINNSTTDYSQSTTHGVNAPGGNFSAPMTFGPSTSNSSNQQGRQSEHLSEPRHPSTSALPSQAPQSILSERTQSPNPEAGQGTLQKDQETSSPRRNLKQRRSLSPLAPNSLFSKQPWSSDGKEQKQIKKTSKKPEIQSLFGGEPTYESEDDLSSPLSSLNSWSSSSSSSSSSSTTTSSSSSATSSSDTPKLPERNKELDRQSSPSPLVQHSALNTNKKRTTRDADADQEKKNETASSSKKKAR